MTLIRHPAPKLRLTRLLSRPDGLTVAEALERADARLAEIVPPCATALHEALDQLAAACARLQGAPADEAAQGAAYRAADEVLGLAGPAKAEDLGAAAYSLCDLIDRFQTGAPFRPQAVQVHLDALSLLRRPASETGGEACRRAVLDGLTRVVRSVVPPAPALA